MELQVDCNRLQLAENVDLGQAFTTWSALNGLRASPPYVLYDHFGSFSDGREEVVALDDVSFVLLSCVVSDGNVFGPTDRLIGQRTFK